MITAETSGFSGKPISTVFSEEEFHAGFIEPFVRDAARIGFPLDGRWLWIGPSGPHIIGKAVREIVRTVGGRDPYSIDFDSRWYKKMPPGSLSQERYMKHIEEQTFHVLETQSVDVIFTTPPVLHMLASRMSQEARERIRGVHYGGVAITADEYRLFHHAFSRAVHVSGYGNSLFGVFIERSWDETGITYSTNSSRIDVDVVHVEDGTINMCAVGETGRVLMSRYDESFLIINMLERDCATKAVEGITDPRPPATSLTQKVLY
jgi:hypothetical protein